MPARRRIRTLTSSTVRQPVRRFTENRLGGAGPVQKSRWRGEPDAVYVARLPKSARCSKFFAAVAENGAFENVNFRKNMNFWLEK